MKRILCLMLGVVMMLSASMTVLAANDDVIENIALGTQYWTYDKDDELFYEADIDDHIEFGESYYLFLQGDVTGYTLSDLKYYDLKTDFDKGAKYIEDVEFVRVRDDNAGNMRFAIRFTTKDMVSLKEYDVEGVIKLVARKDAVITTSNGNEVDEYEFLVLNTVISCGDPVDAEDFDYEHDHVIQFDDVDDEIDLEFDDVIFTVNGKNQSDVYIDYSNEVIEAIYNKYPDSDLEFHLFRGDMDTFHRTGILSIPSEDDDLCVYVINDDNTLSMVVNAEYDKWDDAYLIRTRSLKNYVLGPKGLNKTIVEDNTVEIVPPVVIVNPNTGACA